MKNVARIISSKKLAKSSSRALALASTQECKNSLIRSTTGFATPQQQQQFSTFINPSVFKTTNYVRAPETNDQPKEHYFNKILIANRGEIAVRIIKTCRKLGIKTVAVYSDADANNKHVRMADEAVYIGGSSPADSYLRANRIIAAMK